MTMTSASTLGPMFCALILQLLQFSNDPLNSYHYPQQISRDNAEYRWYCSNQHRQDWNASQAEDRVNSAAACSLDSPLLFGL